MKNSILLLGALGLTALACTTTRPGYAYADDATVAEAPPDVPELPAAPPPPQAEPVTTYAAPQQVQVVSQPAPVVAQQNLGTGQWVNTQQYGWVYMPYAASYSYAPQPGVAYTYVYSSGAGWRWVTSPWVWGSGARPYFTYGAQYHSWYRPTYWGNGYRWGGVVQGRPYRGGAYRR